MSTVAESSRPRLADGVEVLGEYAGSGYRKPHYMLRRGDGQVIQITHLLYLIARELDGTHTVTEIAERVTDQLARRVSAAQVDTLVTSKLEPRGLVQTEAGEARHVEKLSPLLRLRLRAKALPSPVVQRLARLFKPLFVAPVVVVVVAAWLLMLVWLFVVHGIGDSLRQAIYEPAVFLLVLALVVASAAFHEFGHAAACSYGGATPGIIGAGVYIAWPAFFTDVTDSYRLARVGRLRTDLGGVYFNLVFSLGTFAAYAATGYEPLLLVVMLQQAEMIHQLLPVVRLDGYYILADLTGVPDLFRRVRPILVSLLPWRRTDPAASELKPWVRAAVTAWVLVIVPFLLVNLAILVIYLPRMIATAWDSGRAQVRAVSGALQEADLLGVLSGFVHVVALTIPILGIGITLFTIARRVLRKIRQHPAIGVPALAAVAALAFLALKPDGDYTPLRPGERLRLGEIATALVTGDPTPASVAPLRSELPGEGPPPPQPVGDAGTPIRAPRRATEAPTAPAPPVGVDQVQAPASAGAPSAVTVPPLPAVPDVPAAPAPTLPAVPAVPAPTLPPARAVPAPTLPAVPAVPAEDVTSPVTVPPVTVVASVAPLDTPAPVPQPTAPAVEPTLPPVTAPQTPTVTTVAIPIP